MLYALLIFITKKSQSTKLPFKMKLFFVDNFHAYNLMEQNFYGSTLPGRHLDDEMDAYSCLKLAHPCYKLESLFEEVRSPQKLRMDKCHPRILQRQG